MLGSKSFEFKINGKICFSEPTKGREQNKQGELLSQIIIFLSGSISKAHSTFRNLSLLKWSDNSCDLWLIFEWRNDLVFNLFVLISCNVYEIISTLSFSSFLISCFFS